jgi:ABC-2 type transport system ATP-binding protein
MQLLRADNIRVEFGPLMAVDGVSFELNGGQLLGLVGPNGAGKTTLLRVLAGLHAPTRGAANIMNAPILGEAELVRHHVGFAPDTPPLYDDLTLVQFLRFIGGAYSLSRQETGERIDFWLEQLWLTEKRDVPVKHLSRGMKQRAALARTFLPSPHVLLLDEPLAGLDPAGRRQLRGVLGMLRNQGCAMIVSSHILSDLEEVATHIAIIERGRIIQWMTTDALHHVELDRRTYRMTTLNGSEDYSGVFTPWPGISDVRVEGRTCTFDYHADETRVAELLAGLTARSVPVTSFTMVTKSLEEAYLRAGVKQVD